MSTKNLKNFVGEYAWNTIKNIAVDADALRKALVTPQNARNVFANLPEYEIRSLCAEISNSGVIGQIRETTQEEIIEAFKSAGYDRVIFDDLDAISECKKYYNLGEIICTYNSLQQRMKEYHMVVAIKKNIDKIKRADVPQREDDYGISILNIQIAKNGSHMSIKNRYNHKVPQCDSTLNNNLDILYPGLQSMVLGYYKLASLSSKQSYYRDITNIGGVYLKYHTERNNVYFGAFVLDGVNGVRFADTSRYFVTKGDGSYHDCIPLVLDFQDKEVIDASQNKRKSSGKAPLLARAMREGLLTSENKEDTETIIATFPDAKRELLQSKKTALQFINFAYGYDFTKPYKVTGVLGKFTAKTLEKATGSDSGILLVCARDSMRLCEMNHGRFNAKDLRRGYNYNIDDFYGQGDFEAVRKSGYTAVYIIQQDKQYIGTPKPDGRGGVNYYRREDPVIDKSGCNVTEARSELERKLRQYKIEKRAREAAEVDYTQDVLEITESFAELKAELITRLTNAETSGDYEKVTDVVGYSSLTWLVRDIESIKKCATSKGFSSVSSARDAIDKSKTKIAELKGKLVAA